MKKTELNVYALSIWLIIISIFMILSHSFDIEIFFVLWLIGMIIGAELISDSFSRPAYIKNITYIIGIGVLIFGLIVARKIQVILG